METKEIKRRIENWLSLDRSTSNTKCPFHQYTSGGNNPYCKFCEELFPRSLNVDECPCDCYTFNYVLKKARKYVKETK